MRQYISSWEREIESSSLLKPTSTSADLKSKIWSNKEMALQYARDYSTLNDLKVLLAEVVDTHSWH